MKLIFKKVLVVFIILFIFTFSHVYAIDMFLSNLSTRENASQDIVSEENSEEDAKNISNTELYRAQSSEVYTTGEITTSSAPTITTTASSSTNTLSISDIINIILIAVCVVLVFLAIAILIRCK